MTELGMHVDKYWRNFGEITNWVDADTVDVRIDAGYKIFHDIRVRFRDTSAPDRREENFHEATAYMENAAPVGTHVLVVTHKYERTYNRFVGELYLIDADENLTSLNDVLLASGYGWVDIK